VQHKKLNREHQKNKSNLNASEWKTKVKSN